MSNLVGKHVRIEQQTASGGDGWRTVRGAERLTLWELIHAAESETGAIRHIFHIPHTEAAQRGRRLHYLGQTFQILKVSDSRRLEGLELTCEASVATDATPPAEAYQDYLRRLAR